MIRARAALWVADEFDLRRHIQFETEVKAPLTSGQVALSNPDIAALASPE